jgi:hypothetical protein
VNSAYPGSKRAPYKKNQIGRKAIRDMTSDIENYVHKVIPKTDEAKGLIYGAIKPNLLFRACSSEELIDLVDAFEPQYVPKGSIVIREGDEGDHFYVMERGGIDVFEKANYKCSLYSGVAFGEIALLYSCPRTASVVAKYDCKLWVINRTAFRGITAQHKKRRLELKLAFLKKVSGTHRLLISACGRDKLIFTLHSIRSKSMIRSWERFSSRQKFIPWPWPLRFKSLGEVARSFVRGRRGMLFT